jgi:hypothetical protein
MLALQVTRNPNGPLHKEALVSQLEVSTATPMDFFSFHALLFPSFVLLVLAMFRLPTHSVQMFASAAPTILAQKERPFHWMLGQEIPFQLPTLTPTNTMYGKALSPPLSITSTPPEPLLLMHACGDHQAAMLVTGLLSIWV